MVIVDRLIALPMEDVGTGSYAWIDKKIEKGEKRYDGEDFVFELLANKYNQIE